MTGTAREIADRQSFAELRDRGYRLLARREYSRHELKTRLASHDRAQQLEAVIQQLVAEGSQSDERFATQLVRTRVAAGKGPKLIGQELRQHRLDDAVVDMALADYADSWRDLAATVRRKKFGTDSPTDYRDWARRARFLQQRGFTPDQIGSYDGD